MKCPFCHADWFSNSKQYLSEHIQDIHDVEEIIEFVVEQAAAAED